MEWYKFENCGIIMSSNLRGEGGAKGCSKMIFKLFFVNIKLNLNCLLSLKLFCALETAHLTCLIQNVCEYFYENEFTYCKSGI